MDPFKRNIIVGYSLSLFLLIASAAASFISIDNLVDSSKWVSHTYEVEKRLEGVLSTLINAETAQRGFLITGKDNFLTPFKGAYEQAGTLINEVKQMTPDNPAQQNDCDLLKTVALDRISFLGETIDLKRKGAAVTDSMLSSGKFYMDSARSLVRRMSAREEALMAERTGRLKTFTIATPAFIIIASLLAIIVTIVSMVRVFNDYKRRTALQFALQKKDEEITRRLAIVDQIATQISAGDYNIKVDDAGADALGGIAGSLNKMSASLDYSFNALKDREWLQSGVAQLNELMIGEKDLAVLSHKVLGFVTGYTSSELGAFYLLSGDRTLELSASVAIEKSALATEVNFGDGLVGQAAQAGKQILISNIEEPQITLNYAAGTIKPVTLFAFPIFHEKKLKGVIEVGSLHKYNQSSLDFLQAVVFNIGMAIHSARDHMRLQDLLSETQAQSEELQAQHSELENINAELEAQTEKLQASEEELRVQQEELQQANQELEERSRLLEEKNELILERNLDIQRKAEELATSTKYKSEFLANMSHELRTPLNSILLLSRLLAENAASNLSSEQVEYSNVIQTSGKSLLKLIDEILDLSKIEAGKMDLEFADLKVKSLLDELHSLFAPMAKEKGLSFSVESAADFSGHMETDKLRLDQILKNLLSNALKFTRSGTVRLYVKEEAGRVIFDVSDTGIGIPASKQGTIFEAFQQADGSTKRQYGGTGLGLSISRELARLLGGEIKLHSEEGKGSTFSLIVPQHKTTIISQTTIQKPVQGTISAKPKPLFVSETIPGNVEDDRMNLQPGDKAVLIIEDDTAFAISVLELARSKGYKGLVAVRGDEGVDLAKKFMPMGILLDIELPVLSGWDVMDELKSDTTTRHIPIHMMSVHDARTKSLSKGAVDFINKPVAFEKLGEAFTKIEQALSRHPKKVLIVEENAQHAKALSYFLGNYEVASEIKTTVEEGIESLGKKEVDCVILDMGIPAQMLYDTLDEVKKTPGLESVPIIIFTGKNLSTVEEARIKQYADSVVVKTAHSFQRIIDEVSLFLHLVEENKSGVKKSKYARLGELTEVLKGKTVLVADDDVRNIFSITKSLEVHGMEVVSAIDGKDAIKQLNLHPKTDIILMDMMMPEMDGYETTKMIREDARYRNLPIIAVTAKAMNGDREKCIAAGASDYITKPVDVDQLLSLLRVWLYQ